MLKPDRRCYVYEVVDKKNGKWYIGSRTGKGCHPGDLGVSYFTCSRLVGPLFRADPSRFLIKILVIGQTDYIIKVEADLLRAAKAKDSSSSYNMANGDAKFNPVKAAVSTVLLGVGVHNRTKEARIIDARKGGLLGGKVTATRRDRGIFARTLEDMQAAGRYASSCMSPGQRIENGRKSGKNAKEKGLGFCGMSTSQRRLNGLKAAETHKNNNTGVHAFSSSQLSEFSKKAQRVRVRGVDCGMISNYSGIARHHASSGHSGKTISHV